jgi:hypothetical protein
MFLVDCEHPSVRMKGLNSNLFWQIDTYCPKFIVFERDYSCLFRRILARRSGCRVNVGIGNEFFTVLCVLCNVMGIKLRTPKNPPPHSTTPLPIYQPPAPFQPMHRNLGIKTRSWHTSLHHQHQTIRFGYNSFWSSTTYANSTRRFRKSIPNLQIIAIDISQNVTQFIPPPFFILFVFSSYLHLLESYSIPINSKLR